MDRPLVTYHYRATAFVEGHPVFGVEQQFFARDVSDAFGKAWIRAAHNLIAQDVHFDAIRMDHVRKGPVPD